MTFEKTNANISEPIAPNWVSCSNCGYNGKPPASAGYHDRSGTTASELNAQNSGKGCVS